MILGQHGNSFRKNALIAHLDICAGRTLGELDLENDFSRTTNCGKITGIAGDVVEHSILCLKSNPRQEPDIVVDGVRYEVKTTGMKASKNCKGALEAKEPMSITAVSPEKITGEVYFDSNFWHKIAHLLLFYYLYDSPDAVKASGYAKFPLLTYQFHDYDDYTEEERRTLQSDWQKVKNFIVYLQEHYEDFEKEYPRLSHDLRQELMLIDTAPKWPNRPRFRFKRTFVTSIYQRHAAKSNQKERLPAEYCEIHDIYGKCSGLAKQYRGMTVRELCVRFGIKIPDKTLKSIAEPIIVKMFGGTRSKMSDIDLFSKIGLVGKSIVLTRAGRRTEDTKFFTIDFSEFIDGNTKFEDSQFYDFFSSRKILFVVFEEPDENASLLENRFRGFSLVTFDQEFIDTEVRRTWERIMHLVRSGTLRDIPVVDSRTGNQVLNRNGETRTAPNFPKSSESTVFVRGTGSDSRDKRETVNGIKMYRQQVWVKGTHMAEMVAQSYLMD